MSKPLAAVCLAVALGACAQETTTPKVELKPSLADALKVRQAQLDACRADNQALRLAAQQLQAERKADVAHAALLTVVEEIKPADCPKCELMDDMTWKAPPPPPSPPPKPEAEKKK